MLYQLKDSGVQLNKQLLWRIKKLKFRVGNTHFMCVFVAIEAFQLPRNYAVSTSQSFQLNGCRLGWIGDCVIVDREQPW